MRKIHVTNVQFSPPMVRALRDGTKTQTRRLPAAKWAKLHAEFKAGKPCYMYVQEHHCAYDGEPLYISNIRDDGSITTIYGKIHPPMHMRREWSRSLLTVTDSRVVRLQDITMRQCLAEGIAGDQTFPQLWDSLHTKSGTKWLDNPIVYALKFVVTHANIDAYLKEKGLTS